MSIVSITEETRLVVEHYLEKQQKRIQKRKAKMEEEITLGLRPARKIPEKKEKKILVKPIKPRKNDLHKVKTYIVHLKKIAWNLEHRQSMSGSDIFIEDKDQHHINSVINLLNSALQDLKLIK